MPNYQLQFGKHLLGIHYDEQWKSHMMIKPGGKVPRFDHAICEAWPIGKSDKLNFYDLFKDLGYSDEVYNDEYTPRIIICLKRRFKEQNKSKAWINDFFAETTLTAEQLIAAEQIEYGSKKIADAAKTMKIGNPNFNRMKKDELFQYLVANGVLDVPRETTNKIMIEKCEEIFLKPSDVPKID